MSVYKMTGIFCIAYNLIRGTAPKAIWRTKPNPPQSHRKYPKVAVEE